MGYWILYTNAGERILAHKGLHVVEARDLAEMRSMLRDLADRDTMVVRGELVKGWLEELDAAGLLGKEE